MKLIDRPAPFAVLALLMLYLTLLPTSIAGLKDEWGYYRVALNLPEYGLDLYRRSEMTSTGLALLGGGYLFTAVAGKSLAVARAFVLAVSLAGLLWGYRLLGKLGKTRTASLVFVALLAVNPLFARYAHTFTTDAVFLVFSLLALILYVLGMERDNDRDLALGSVAATLAIYTRQPGIFLPAVPITLAAFRWLARGQPPRLRSLLILILPYLAFLPLSLFFYVHSGSFFMYVTKVEDHPFGSGQIRHVLWAVNFLGFFSAPFLYQILRSNWRLLKRAGGTPLLLCVLLAPSILASEGTVTSTMGGLGRIFAALHLPGLVLVAVQIACQFAGLVTLWILLARALEKACLERAFLLFSVFYVAVVCIKGGLLLVHYAAPLVLPVALVSATSFGGAFAGSRKLFVAGVLLMALFSAVWSKAESALGDAIYHSVRFIEQTRGEGDLTYTGSSTAIQLLSLEGVTFARKQAAFGLITPEDLKPKLVPANFSPNFRVVREFPVELLGPSLGKVLVFRREREAVAGEEGPDPLEGWKP